ncbi:MAG: N-acetylmuramic acid 6-phosphate etherase [Acidobacteria bacterium]|nr:N-acetylmuramic acid 6-phosphate etherase [Acidobacteriota bacterium]
MPPKQLDEIRILQSLATEQPNPLSAGLDKKSALNIARIINGEDQKVAVAVKAALPQIARAIEWIAEALSAGGRLIYVGAGTSARIAVLDAVECPPTFNTRPGAVQFVVAGGTKALASAVESNEDSRSRGLREMRKKHPGKKDVVVGIAASGRTPFTVAAVEWARRRAARTIALTSNPDTPLEQAAELAIVVETGPEVVGGSTRMKAGSAQKMVLNMLSTGAMVRLGYVYGNLMVNLHHGNRKLIERSIRILQQCLSVPRSQAKQLLRTARNHVPAAIVMAKTGVSRAKAHQALNKARGHVGTAIRLAAAAMSRDR